MDWIDNLVNLVISIFVLFKFLLIFWFTLNAKNSFTFPFHVSNIRQKTKVLQFTKNGLLKLVNCIVLYNILHLKEISFV